MGGGKGKGKFGKNGKGKGDGTGKGKWYGPSAEASGYNQELMCQALMQGGTMGLLQEQQRQQAQQSWICRWRPRTPPLAPAF